MNIPTMMVMIGANTVGLNKGIGDMYRMKRAVSVAANSMNQSLMTTNVMLDKTNASLTALNAQANVASASMANLGRTMTMFVSLPLGLIGVASAKMFSEFEFNLSKVTGLVGVAAEQTQQWSKEILNLSTATGKGPKELSEALYYVTTGGIHGAETMEVMNVSAKAAAAGMGEIKDIADVLVSAMNAYGKENLNAAQAADILVKSVKEGKAEANQLITAFGVVTPIASMLGISYDQVGAGLAAMTRTGTTAATSATQLRRILFTLLKPSQQVETALERMGTSSQNLRNVFRFEGLLPGLLKIQELTSEWGEEMMGQVFPNIRAFAGAVDILGANLEQNKKIFESVANSTGALNHAFSVVSDTFKFKLDVALSKGRVTMVKLGEVVANNLIPIIEAFGNVMQDFGRWFSGLDKTMQNTVVKFAGLALVVGPLQLLFSGLKSVLMPAYTVLANIAKVAFSPLINQTQNLQKATNGLAVSLSRQAAAEKLLNSTQFARYANYGKIIAAQQLAQKANIKAVASNIQVIASQQSQAVSSLHLAKATSAYNAAQKKVNEAQAFHKNIQKGSLAAYAKMQTTSEKLARVQLAYAAAKSKSNLQDALGLRSTASLIGAETLRAEVRKAGLAARIAEARYEKSLITLGESRTAVLNAKIKASSRFHTVTAKTNALREIEIKLAARQRKASLLAAEAIRLETAAKEMQRKAYEKAVVANAMYMAKTNKTYADARKMHLANIGKQYKERQTTAPIFAPTSYKSPDGFKAAGAVTQNAQIIAARKAAEKAAERAAANTVKNTGIMSKAFRGLNVAALAAGNALKWVWGIMVANPLTSLLALAGGIYLLIKAKNKLTNIQKVENDVREKTADAIAGEVGKINTYVRMAENERMSKEMRLEAIEKLVEISPAYFGGLDLEATKLGKLKGAADAYNGSLRERIRLQVLQEAMVENEMQYQKDVLSGKDKEEPWQVGAALSIQQQHPAFMLTRLLAKFKPTDANMEKVMMDFNKKQYEERQTYYDQQLMDRSGVVDDITKRYDYLSNTIQSVYTDEINMQEKVRTKTTQNAKEVDSLNRKHQERKEGLHEELGVLNALAKSQLAFLEGATKHWKTDAQEAFIAKLKEVVDFTDAQLEKLALIFNTAESNTGENITAILTLFFDYDKALKALERSEQLNLTPTYDDKVSEKLKLLEKTLGDIASKEGHLLSVKDKRVQQLRTEYLVLKGYNEVLAQDKERLEEYYNTNMEIMDVMSDFEVIANKLGTTLKDLEGEYGIDFFIKEPSIPTMEGAEPVMMITGISSLGKNLIEGLGDAQDVINATQLSLTNLTNQAENSGSMFSTVAAKVEVYENAIENLRKSTIQLTAAQKEQLQEYYRLLALAKLDLIDENVVGQLKEIEIKLNNFGNLWTGVGNKVRVYESALEDAMNMQMRFIQGTEEFERLRKKVEELRTALISLSSEIIDDSIERMAHQAYIAGSNFNYMSAAISMLQSELDRLYDLGLREGDELFDTLTEKLKSLNQVLNMSDTFSALGSAIQEVNSALESGPAENWWIWIAKVLQDIPKVIEMFHGLIAVQALDEVQKKATAIAANNAAAAKLNEAMAGGLSASMTAVDTAATKTNTNALNANTAASALNSTASAVETGADSGAAIAGATKSGAKLPFPMNLIAIAAGVAAVISAIATIPRAKKAAQMKTGGIVPAGYPNDTYPAMLTSGETVIPPGKLPDFEREPVQVHVTVEGVIRGKDIHYITKEIERKYQNSY